MIIRKKLTGLFVISAFTLALSSGFAVAKETKGGKNLYLVEGKQGPGFGTPEEAIKMLESTVLPGLDALNKMLGEKTILAGGLPAAGRATVFIMEASSNDELDRMLRSNPIWPLLQWKVTPLQSFESRISMERGAIEQMKKKMR